MSMLIFEVALNIYPFWERERDDNKYNGEPRFYYYFSSGVQISKFYVILFIYL